MLIIVNYANICGFTLLNEYRLSTMAKKYGDKLAVLMFPSNSFYQVSPTRIFIRPATFETITVIKLTVREGIYFDILNGRFGFVLQFTSYVRYKHGVRVFLMIKPIRQIGSETVPHDTMAGYK